MSLLRPLRALTWKHWAWATAIPILLAISGPLQNFHQNRYWALEQIVFSVPKLLIFSYALLIAIAFAESSVPEGTAPRARRYILALLAASTVWLATGAWFPGLTRKPPFEVRAGQTIAAISSSSPDRTARANFLITAPSQLCYGWIATFIYVRLRKSRLAARALADAELERSEAQRRLLAAQLVAAHAQVDPAFVLEKLEDVERAYESDPARADLLLDEFIVFLRDAIPRLRAEDGAPVT